MFAGEVLVVLIILGLTRRIADTPPEKGARLDVVGTLLSALGQNSKARIEGLRASLSVLAVIA